MDNNNLPDRVVDKSRILNNGLSMNLTKVVNSIATVEYFEGDEGIHKVVEVEIDRLAESQ